MFGKLNEMVDKKYKKKNIEIKYIWTGKCNLEKQFISFYVSSHDQP